MFIRRTDVTTGAGNTDGNLIYKTNLNDEMQQKKYFTNNVPRTSRQANLNGGSIIGDN